MWTRIRRQGKILVHTLYIGGASSSKGPSTWLRRSNPSIGNLTVSSTFDRTTWLLWAQWLNVNRLRCRIRMSGTDHKAIIFNAHTCFLQLGQYQALRSSNCSPSINFSMQSCKSIVVMSLPSANGREIVENTSNLILSLPHTGHVKWLRCIPWQWSTTILSCLSRCFLHVSIAALFHSLFSFLKKANLFNMFAV